MTEHSENELDSAQESGATTREQEQKEYESSHRRFSQLRSLYFLDAGSLSADHNDVKDVPGAKRYKTEGKLFVLASSRQDGRSADELVEFAAGEFSYESLSTHALLRALPFDVYLVHNGSIEMVDRTLQEQMQKDPRQYLIDKSIMVATVGEGTKTANLPKEWSGSGAVTSRMQRNRKLETPQNALLGIKYEPSPIPLTTLNAELEQLIVARRSLGTAEALRSTMEAIVAKNYPDFTAWAAAQSQRSDDLFQRFMKEDRPLTVAEQSAEHDWKNIQLLAEVACGHVPTILTEEEFEKLKNFIRAVPR